jgi:serine/threonine protein kinase
VEGDTLAERVARGPLPATEARAIAAQIADALEAAHERGIVHRDLKPANIKITPSGVVKVLDFGLAKTATGDDAGPDLTHSPTVTMDGTRDGVVLGTAAYMSPEQARGKVVDKRSDIWSFGCVLFETLAGRSAFAGETLSDTIAKILEREPDWRALPDRTPPALERLLRRCLEKDPKQRPRDRARKLGRRVRTSPPPGRGGNALPRLLRRRLSLPRRSRQGLGTSRALRRWCAQPSCSSFCRRRRKRGSWSASKRRSSPSRRMDRRSRLSRDLRTAPAESGFGRCRPPRPVHWRAPKEHPPRSGRPTDDLWRSSPAISSSGSTCPAGPP